MARVGLALAASVVIGSREASAQFAPPPPSPSSSMSGMAMMGNPYLNPYMNPYLNQGLYPGLKQQPITGGNALLFLYAAQSANGGIGSGRISGTRPDPTAPVGARARRSRAGEMSALTGVPGAGAAKYFNPGGVNGPGSGRYYNQRGRYFMNNGR
jgi:hypothetical protein